MKTGVKIGFCYGISAVSFFLIAVFTSEIDSRWIALLYVPSCVLGWMGVYYLRGWKEIPDIYKNSNRPWLFFYGYPAIISLIAFGILAHGL